jgi:ribosomal-protein-alanine N-acetyltransferase
MEGNCDTLLSVELHTSRLVLRPVAVEDVAMVHAYRGCPEAVAYLTHAALDLDQTRERLARAAALWQSAEKERFNLTFVVLLDGAVIGDVHAWNMAEQFQPASPDPADVWIGYAFNPRDHGHGYATEAMKSLLDWLFAQRAERVFANTYTDNTRSVALLQRLGFKEYRHYTAEQDASGKHLASCRMRLGRDVISGIESGATSQPA